MRKTQENIQNITFRHNQLNLGWKFIEPFLVGKRNIRKQNINTHKVILWSVWYETGKGA